MENDKKKIVLASSSPRRKMLLEAVGLDFIVDASSYEEDMTLDLSPEELVKTLAMGKARDVASRYTGAIVLGADTMVFIDDHRLGKPHTEERAREMLRFLSGKSHVLMTGFALLDTDTGKIVSEAHPVQIYFKELSQEDIDWYIGTGEPLERAGAYSMQEQGGVFIERIEGDRDAGIGLPVKRIIELLKDF